jgi:hypothetical protein
MPPELAVAVLLHLPPDRAIRPQTAETLFWVSAGN